MIKKAFELQIEDSQKVVVEHDTDKEEYRVWVEKQDGSIVKRKSVWQKLQDDYLLDNGGSSEIELNLNFYDAIKIDGALKPLFRDYLGSIKKTNYKFSLFVGGIIAKIPIRDIELKEFIEIIKSGKYSRWYTEIQTTFY